MQSCSFPVWVTLEVALIYANKLKVASTKYRQNCVDFFMSNVYFYKKTAIITDFFQRNRQRNDYMKAVPFEGKIPIHRQKYTVFVRLNGYF